MQHLVCGEVQPTNAKCTGPLDDARQPHTAKYIRAKPPTIADRTMDQNLLRRGMIAIWF